VAGFAVASAVGKNGENSYAAEVDPLWAIGTKPNGGYLTAILARAAVDAAGPDHPHPVAVSAHFVAAPAPGPVDVQVEVLRRGRSAAQVRATLSAGGTPLVEALVTCGRLPSAPTPYFSAVEPPAMPAEQDCPRIPDVGPGGVQVPIFREAELRLDPATTGFAIASPSGRGIIQGWVRIAADDPDPFAALVAADILPPATFELGILGSWVPTLELTTHLRAVPAPGPLRVRHRARLVAASRVDEECDVWDAQGTLVASARQLAAIRIPGEDA
jgi:acyl-coenzyme A thioesterase PaaI-like protein